MYHFGNQEKHLVCFQIHNDKSTVVGNTFSFCSSNADFDEEDGINNVCSARTKHFVWCKDTPLRTYSAVTK